MHLSRGVVESRENYVVNPERRNNCGWLALPNEASLLQGSVDLGGFIVGTRRGEMNNADPASMKPRFRLANLGHRGECGEAVHSA